MHNVDTFVYDMTADNQLTILESTTEPNLTLYKDMCAPHDISPP